MGHKKAKAPLDLDGEELGGHWGWELHGVVVERTCGYGEDSRDTGQPKHLERRWLIHTLAAIQNPTTPGVS